MTDVNSMIKADAEKRIAEFEEMAQDAESKIKHLETTKAFAAQKIEEYGKVLRNANAKADESTYAVQWLNTDNLETIRPESVEMHRAGCAHLNVYKNLPGVRAGLTEISPVEYWASAQDFFDDYNADFYEEGGNDACWSVAVFPCTRMVSEVTAITEMSTSN